MEILRNVEIEISVECGFPGELAFSVFVVSAVVPHRIASVEVRPYVVRNIRNDQLRFRNVVPLEILEIIIEQLALNLFLSIESTFHHLNPPFPVL